MNYTLIFFAITQEGILMGFKLDKKDLEIVRNLWDGRTPYKEIAKKVGLTTNTVRNRVKRMLREGALQIISLINPNAVENHSSALIGFKIVPKDIDKIFNQILQLKGLVAAAIVTGRFDVMAVFMFNSEHSYSRFLHEELKKVDGLISMETFFVIGGETWQLRYVL